ncbi:MAG: DUF1304 family protein [Ahrensia sp.]|nr:DUF1304 family protein [Ahrensia sp.]
MRVYWLRSGGRAHESTEPDFRRGTALALISVGLLEIFRHGDQRLHRIFLIEPDDVRAVRMWAMNVGAYNMAFGLGIATGLWMVNVGGQTAGGSAIVTFAAPAISFQVSGWSREKRLLISAVGQALFPGLAVIFLYVVRLTEP